MKKLLLLTTLCMNAWHSLHSINPMAAAMEAAAKKTTPKSSTPKPATPKSTSSSKKNIKKSQKTTDIAKEKGKMITVNIINKSPKKAASIKSISMQYLPPGASQSSNVTLEKISMPTTSKALEKKFTIPPFKKDSPKKVSAIFSLNLAPGSSYAGVSELTIGPEKQIVNIDSTAWSSASKDSKTPNKGSGWIDSIAGAPNGIFINHDGEKWVLDIEAMKASAQGEKVQNSQPATVTKKIKQKKLNTKKSSASKSAVIAMSKAKKKNNIKKSHT